MAKAWLTRLDGNLTPEEEMLENKEFIGLRPDQSLDEWVDPDGEDADDDDDDEFMQRYEQDKEKDIEKELSHLEEILDRCRKKARLLDKASYEKAVAMMTKMEDKIDGARKKVAETNRTVEDRDARCDIKYDLLVEIEGRFYCEISEIEELIDQAR